MSTHDASPREALMRLGASTAEAVAQALDALAPGAVQRGEVTVMAEGVTPFTDLPLGAVASSVSYADEGTNVFVLPPAAARALGAAMGVPAPESRGDGAAPSELSDREVSAVADAANQMMAAAARAMGLITGQDIEISAPDTRVLSGQDAAADAFGAAQHATSTTVSISGEPCRLIQLVPGAILTRMVGSIDGFAAATGEGDGATAATSRAETSATVGVEDALSAVNLRVWAELGRTRLSLGSALQLPRGAVVDLDCAPDDPIELFVNGVRFAQGHLLVTDDGEWAVVIDHLAPRQGAATDLAAGVAVAA